MRILLIQTAFIGDAVLTLPLIQALAEKHDAEIDVVAIPGTAQVFRSSPFVNEVFVLKKRAEHKSLLSVWKFGRELGRQEYDRLYSPHRSLRSTLLMLATGIKETWGFSTAAFSRLYKHIVPYQKDAHEVKRLLAFAAPADGADWKIPPVMRVSKQQRMEVEKFLADLPAGKPIAAIAPGSVWETKRYPSSNFAEILRYLHAKDFLILLIGAEGEKKLCQELQQAVPESAHNAAGKFSLPQSVDLLRRCSLLLTTDSAPTHLGMAANIPVITLYCSTVPAFGFYPYNNRSRSLSYDEPACKPCGIHGKRKCPIATFECGYGLRPETVFEAIEDCMSYENNRAD